AGGVLISGTPAEGQTLTASVTDPDGVPATGVTYTWQALVASSWTTLQSGGSNQYVVPYDTHTGEPVRVLASYTDAQNHAESLTSAATSAVTDVNRPGDVLISGTLAEGQTLTASVTDPQADERGWAAARPRVGAADRSTTRRPTIRPASRCGFSRATRTRRTMPRA